MLILYAFVGFENSVVPAGETADPRRTIPRALIATVVATAAIYFLVQLAYVAVMPAGPAPAAPLAAFAEVLIGPAGALLLSAAALASVAGNIGSALTSTPRVTFALAGQGSLPAWFGAVSARWSTPANSVLFMGLVVAALALSGSFVWLAIVSTLARLVVYAVSIAALPKAEKAGAAGVGAGRGRARHLPVGGVAVEMAILGGARRCRGRRQLALSARAARRFGLILADAARNGRMNPDPQKYFVGLLDFFSIWLPGALLTYPIAVDQQLVSPSQMQVSHWFLLFFASYLVGHFLFLIGSLLDSPVYDRLRQGTRQHQIQTLAKGGRLASWPIRWFADRVFARFDPALRQAIRLREAELAPLGLAGSINSFQWCKVRLALDQPAALAEVERLEADLKFFRSFCVVLAAFAFWGAGRLLTLWRDGTLDWWRSLGLFVAGLAAFGFSLWRYAERRNRSTTQAYWFVIGMVGEKGVRPAPSTTAGDALTHAGGVVLRRAREKTRVLVVRNSRDSGWVLPKGHIAAGETPEEAAVREVLEETAIWARVRDPLATDRLFQLDDETVCVRFFVMEYLGEARRPKVERHPWLPARRPPGDAPRKIRWPRLEKPPKLPDESLEAVGEARTYVKAGSRSAATVSSIQPPPSSRSPS